MFNRKKTIIISSSLAMALMLSPIFIKAAPTGWDNVDNQWTGNNTAPSYNTNPIPSNNYNNSTNNNPVPAPSTGVNDYTNYYNQDNSNNYSQATPEAVSPRLNGQTSDVPSARNNLDDNSQSSSSSSSSKKTSESSKSYSHDELVDYAKKAGQDLVKKVKADNQLRSQVNHDKGADDLKAAYLAQRATIKKSKISNTQKQQMIATQKAALQKALNQRLGSLQNVHDQTVDALSKQITALPDGHSYDKQALILQSQLANADYQLGADSNKAYDRYNRSLDALTTSQTSSKTKHEQLQNAHNDYRGNLAALNAIDPDELNRDNRSRLKQAKQLAKKVVQQAEADSFKSPSEIDDYLRN